MDTSSLARLPRSFQEIFQGFAWVARRETFENLCWVLLGWILNHSRQTLSRALVAVWGPEYEKHHSAFYRLLSGASWEVDDLGEALFVKLLRFIPREIVVAVDDTLCEKSGPFLFGGGMHRNEKSSGAAGRRMRFSFGHNFVVLAVWIPRPWNPAKGVAIPLLARLFRSQKTCPKKDYRKRTELAVEMIQRFGDWVEAYAPERRVVLVGDTEYACHLVVQNLPKDLDCEFVGPIRMNAALYRTLDEAPLKNIGRPRVKGTRLPNPEALAEDPTLPWLNISARIYGRTVSLQVKIRKVLWYTVAKSKPVLLVIVRDPRGRYEDRAYFSTRPDATAEEVLQIIAQRWALEVTFRDTKQFLGLEDPQSGFGRRRRRPKGRPKPGPQHRGSKGKKAVTRTAPTILIAYGLTWLWYLENGNPAKDVALARRERPWYRQKSEPSYEDILRAARRALAQAGVSADPLGIRFLQNTKAAPEGAARAA